MDTSRHIPVLLEETISGLNIKKDGIYVDCTMGGAGHASEILKRIKKNGKLYCFEQDSYAVFKGATKLSEIDDNFIIIPDNFVNIKQQLKILDVNKVDGILYDLGVSSFQFDIGERGFSYNYDAKLDMRMNQDQELTAYEVVNEYSFEQLKKILYVYGEEKHAASIVKKIIREREKKAIETTLQLSEIIKTALPAKVRRKEGHPAKKTFQAIRIAVNDELNVFEKSLRDALTLLKKGGRICVISFHSLEDRICKSVFKEMVNENIPKGLPVKDVDIVRNFKIINNRVITPSANELLLNNRAHSAKLRIIEKL
ncbi:MAG: 16S rRNA (cytosine(1402)-N(4))-methyltransferase RsmH [Bacilli bacterium]|jgi:16S rRNA (cytosine1402-N4)-methyltransferase|nr:16S rRNA (cytosine(1402)-N(4))-methyltransferase RsmH [Bacilli bacterium]MDD2681493.1 16S rRNA (cytosine(1402)-N(4))-methyltransferase RsmH [Bacilli bacterium]MDD3121573.1 16S rRNA (cytosine(1402)-N(4))-methyltransferase RsmH [Bacilli bacterium]MDD4062932.1 16S rRNA (cytosine(1402)-N(4))-methyltransferase RsmH [Bacilli bacterium]MDD4482290.1 16S rRNA (cytosine(1402)-N(4))-methyltransferase RsmH [Bacilli bacterium]